jgi:hypothetical protein
MPSFITRGFDLALIPKKLSNAWQVVLAFFLGGAVSSIAQDPSDYLYFWAGAHNLLTTTNGQLLFWYFVPFLLYISFFLLGLLMAKAGLFEPVTILYVFAAVVVFSSILSLKLPQFTSPEFQASLLVATLISLGIVVGVQRQVAHK